MSSYSVIHQEKIEAHITFIRIKPNDIAATLREIITSLADLSWINKFDVDYVRTSLTVRAQSTVDYLTANIIKATDDSITKDSGEYVVSELARKSLIEQLLYSDIPLAELIKQQRSGNPGFDFYCENLSLVVLFGEAKYNSNQNAYGLALEQIVRFECEKRDHSDLVDIERFCKPQSLTNASKNTKGYVAAFSCRTTDSKTLIENIKENANFKLLTKFHELVCVAVEL